MSLRGESFVIKDGFLCALYLINLRVFALNIYSLCLGYKTEKESPLLNATGFLILGLRALRKTLRI